MKYGISELAIIPMRNSSSDKEEMINQILFGEHFQVLEKRKKWSKIRLAHDKYEGWICNKQWTEIDHNNFKKLEEKKPVITTDIFDIITKDYPQPIVIGSILPFYTDSHTFIGKNKYKFSGRTTKGFTEKQKIIENAMIYLNTPYLWGGRSPFGIDCSGFTQMIYRLQGITLPRDAYQQAEIGNTLSFLEESEAGDLAFFDNNEGNITHVGIILENSHIIHASGMVRIDRIDQQGIFNQTLGSHTHKLRLIKNII